MNKAKIAVLILSILVYIIISFIGYKVINNWKEEKKVKVTNEVVQLILNNETSKAEKLFSSNEKLFQSIVNETKPFPLSVPDLLYNKQVIKIRKDTDEITFYLFDDCINGCSFWVDIVYTKNSKPDHNYIKLKDNWYLEKESLWET